MQITFDPLVAAEADYVRRMLGGDTLTLTVDGVSAEVTAEQMERMLNAGMALASSEEPAAVRAEVAATIAQADRPDVGIIPRSELSGEQLRAAYEAPIGASAAPLPPVAPLPAAADLFGTAPAVPPAGAASVPPVPSPPVPAAPAPVSAPRATALPVIPADAVDKHGLPWDERIHSGTRVKNADGSWRQRRGVNDAAFIKGVEDELRALMALQARPGVALEGAAPLDATGANETAPAETVSVITAVPPAPPIPAPPAPVTPIAPTPAAQAGNAATTDAGNVPPPPVVPAPVTSAPATAPIPSPPVPPAPTAADPTAPRISFAQLMLKITGALREKKITAEQVHAGLAKVDLQPSEMNVLAARTELINAVDDHISAIVGAA